MQKEFDSVWSTTRHKMTFEFDAYGPDAICPMSNHLGDAIDILTQPQALNMVLTHSITTTRNHKRRVFIENVRQYPAVPVAVPVRK